MKTDTVSVKTSEKYLENKKRSDERKFGTRLKPLRACLLTVKSLSVIFVLCHIIELWLFQKALHKEYQISVPSLTPFHSIVLWDPHRPHKRLSDPGRQAVTGTGSVGRLSTMYAFLWVDLNNPVSVTLMKLGTLDPGAFGFQKCTQFSSVFRFCSFVKTVKKMCFLLPNAQMTVCCADCLMIARDTFSWSSAE